MWAFLSGSNHSFFIEQHSKPQHAQTKFLSPPPSCLSSHTRARVLSLSLAVPLIQQPTYTDMSIYIFIQITFYVCKYVSLYAYIHSYECIRHTPVSICACAWMCVYTYTHVYAPEYVHVYTYIYMYVRAHIRTCTRVHITCVQIYTHTHVAAKRRGISCSLFRQRHVEPALGRCARQIGMSFSLCLCVCWTVDLCVVCVLASLCVLIFVCLYSVCLSDYRSSVYLVCSCVFQSVCFCICAVCVCVAVFLYVYTMFIYTDMQIYL